MKKLIALSLAAVLLISSLTACGSRTVTVETSSDTSPKVTAKASPAAESSDASTQTFARGTIDRNVYTNEFADFVFTKPDSWSYATDEEIASLMNLSVQIMDDPDYVERVSKQTTIYDMVAKDPAVGNSIVVMFENLAVTASTSCTEAQYAQATQNGLKSAQSQIQYSFSDTSVKKIGNRSYLFFSATGSKSSSSFSQYYLLRKLGSYMFVAIISVMDDTPVSDILSMIS